LKCVIVWCVEVAASRFESGSGRLSELVNRDFIVDIQLERVPLVHRATTVFCDSRAANYAVLQSHPNSWSVHFRTFITLKMWDNRSRIDQLISGMEFSRLEYRY